MVRARNFGVALVVVGLVIAVVVGWTRSPAAAAAGPQVVGGDPSLADLAIILPGDVRGSGKFSFFMIERENSSHRWFMRFDSETGTLAKLTTDKGWVTVGSPSDMGR